ncbi:MAG: DNA replication/repair protein RecF [Clostridia bacterium]|nr:DNA replication/repair protein RecF [Clostridia bacterium]
MIITSITYKNFRNIGETTLALSEGVNILCGNNAQGKTNALEGVYIFAGGRSFRTPREKELIRFGEKSASLELSYHTAERNRSLSIKFTSDGKRQCEKNGVKLRKMSEFIGNFRAVLFCPGHLAIVREGPSMRRNFLDVALSQLEPVYVASLQRYNAVLARRNKLLDDWQNQSPASRSTLDLWDEQLAREAAMISAKRAQYVERLGEIVDGIFAEMTSSRESVRLEYKKPMTEGEYMDALKNLREREIRLGTTLCGTHRDDIAIYLNGREARLYGSQGQQRSVALAMKLAEGAISKEKSGEWPVFLLDDILSELDEERREYVLGGLTGRQVLITACERGLFAQKGGSLWHVADGTYVKEDGE